MLGWLKRKVDPALVPPLAPPSPAIEATYDWSDVPLVPAMRIRHPDLQGVPCPLSDGREWLLARTGQEDKADFVDLRDRIYDQLKASRGISRLDLFWACRSALLINYHMSYEESVFLCRESEAFNYEKKYNGLVPLAAIVGAIIPSHEPGEFRYTDWMRAALIANNLEPSVIPPDDIPGVLVMLVATGRACEPRHLVASEKAKQGDDYGHTLAKIYQAAKNGKGPAPAHEPEPEPDPGTEPGA